MGQGTGHDFSGGGNGSISGNQVVLERPDRPGDPPGLFDHVIPPGVPGLVQQIQDTGKTRPSRQVFGRKIRAREEGFQVGCEEYRIGPPAAARDELRGCHVDLVDVRAFLAVYLDVHEMGVHDGRDIRIGEHLPFHDVAPVAGRIAHGKEDGLFLPPRAVDRFPAPGIPVHRIVGMAA